VLTSLIHVCVYMYIYYVHVLNSGVDNVGALPAEFIPEHLRSTVLNFDLAYLHV